MTKVSVLQLDTHFPRIPGDVACPDTYRTPPEILRLAGADVAAIVTQDPADVDIAPLIKMARRATGDIITTSCGFLAPFEAQIAAAIDRPFLASSLNALPDLLIRADPAAITIITFDATTLNSRHLPTDDPPEMLDIGRDSHLYQVISQDRTTLDAELAGKELISRLKPRLRSETRLLLLECTNLPPYKHLLRAAFGIESFDILNRIEARAHKTVRPAFL